MLSYLTKRELFNLSTNTIIIVIILFSIIFLSRYLYDLPFKIIEGFSDDLDPNIKELLENYIKKEEIFKLNGQDIESQSRHPPGAMQAIKPKVFSKLYLRDFYIKSSFNSCVIDKKSEYVSEHILPILLRHGIRFFNFQIFKVGEELEPVVGVNKTSSSESLTSINYVKFINVIDVLKEHAFISSLPNYKDPLFIHLEICNIYDTNALYKLYYHVKNFGNLSVAKNKPGLDEFYYKKQKKSNDPFVFNSKNRIFFFITINYEIENNSITELLNLSNVYKTFPHDTNEITPSGAVFLMNYSSVSNLGVREGKYIAERNMKNFTICLPDKVSGDNEYENYVYSCDQKDPICYPEPMLYGCQFMPACYFNEDNLQSYNDLFEKRVKSGFIIKHPELRMPDIMVQSNTYKGVKGNESATLNSIESESKNRFPS